MYFIRCVAVLLCCCVAGCNGENNAETPHSNPGKADDPNPSETSPSASSIDPTQPMPLRVSAISAGYNYTCALLGDGRVKCWGANGYGQLGQGNKDHIGDGEDEMGDNLKAIDLGENAKATAISTGVNRSCALLEDGKIKCWGSAVVWGDDDASIGDGEDEMGDNLKAIDLGEKPTAIGTGNTYNNGNIYTCALLEGGKIKCWWEGDSPPNEIESLEDGADNLPYVGFVNDADADADAVELGFAHACALLKGGAVRCWGGNYHGQLGQGNTEDIHSWDKSTNDFSAIDLGTNAKAIAIAAGQYHTCALLEGGKIKCWGAGINGELGQGNKDNIGNADNEMGDNLKAIDLGSNAKAIAITAGNSHTCALLEGGKVKCWGYGKVGILGKGNTDEDNIGDEENEMGDNLKAIDLGEDAKAIAITAGNFHTCALLEGDKVKCWGDNSYGQLGQGNKDVIGDGEDEMGDNLPYVDILGTEK